MSVSTRDTHAATQPAPDRSWWADRQAQQSHAQFRAELQRELPRITTSKEAQRLLQSTFIVGPPER